VSRDAVRSGRWVAILGFPLVVVFYAVFLLDSKMPVPLFFWFFVLWLGAFLLVGGLMGAPAA
jgi:hypothetical protein